MDPEPTTRDIMNAVNDLAETVNVFASRVDERFDRVENRLEKVENRLEKVENRLEKVEAAMVTKEYLDDKLSNLYGDLSVLIRKGDMKLKALVEILQKRHVISEEERQQILSMEPFPQNI